MHANRHRDGRHRVVIIGGGFGGLATARALRDAPTDIPIEVTVVDANNFHTFQPLLYQVATAGLDDDNVAFSIRHVLRRVRNTSFRQARVTAVDPDARLVELDRGEPLPYDTLVLAAGAVSHDFGIPGVDKHAVGLKSIEDANRIRLRLLDAFERAVDEPDLIADGALNVVVAGGGPTGVEMAGGLIELFSVLRRDYPTLPVRAARVVLVELADRVLPPFTAESGDRARRTLERRGVEVRLGVGVERVEATRVHLTDGSEIPAHTTVWAAGVRANPLGATLGADLTAGGRIVVADDLSVPTRPEVFVVGDLAAARSAAGGDPLPQVAQPAIQGGRHVADQIVRRLRGLPTEPFGYVDKGQMATIGRHEAVTELPGGRRLSGPIGWLAWLGLHLVYLIGFRNRALVLVNWAWNYLTYDRGSRLLPESQRGA